MVEKTAEKMVAMKADWKETRMAVQMVATTAVESAVQSDS
jgi:hypothetical protein